MIKLSVVISAFNEEKKIRDCLESVKWASEIIFVDNSSTDKTAQIAKEYTSKIFTRPNNPMLNVNKNFGFTKATGSWILSLDADERVTPELRKEIKSVVSCQSLVVGYWIPRKNIIFGKWIKHTGWYPDYQRRLFRKGKGKFPEVHVHEMVTIEGKTGYLTNHLEHLNYETISQFLVKLTNIYGPNEAQILIKRGYKFSWPDSIKMPLREFINRFFAQKGYKDGLHGLVLSLLMAFYHLIVFVKIWEKEGFRVTEEKKFLERVGSESKNISKELGFWYLTARLEETKNLLERIKLRLERKFR